MSSEVENPVVEVAPDVAIASSLEQRLQKIPTSGVDWDLYRAFLSLVQTGSAALAADTLGVSVATFKRRLDRLERSLNAKLYEGDNADFKLTKYGAEISYFVVKADSIITQSSVFEPNPLSKISLCVSPGVFKYFLSQFQKKYEDQIDKWILSINVETYAHLNTKENYDIFISRKPVEFSKFEVIPVGFSSYRYAYNRYYAEKFGVPNLSNLEDHRLIVSMPSLHNPETLESTINLIRRSASAVHTPSFYHSDTLVRSGIGYGLAFAWEKPEEVEIVDELPEVQNVVYVQIRKSFMQNPKYKEFCELLLTAAREYFPSIETR